MLLGAVPIGQNGFQPLPITRPKPDLTSTSLRMPASYSKT
jgi:hypothetical protein